MSKKLKIKKPQVSNALVLFMAVSCFLSGYVVHNSLNKVVENNLGERFWACLENSKGDLQVCSNLVKPEGWERLVRF